MRTLILSDSHFGHTKLTTLGRPVDFTDRIISGLYQMYQTGDQIIHLGDFCIGHDADWHRLVLEGLPAAKMTLIRGNHDHKSYNWYIEHGWNVVCEEMVMLVNGKRVLLTHHPLPKRDGIDHNIHGHTHGNTHRAAEYIDFYDPAYHIEVAPETSRYKPLLLSGLVPSR